MLLVAWFQIFCLEAKKQFYLELFVLNQEGFQHVINSELVLFSPLQDRKVHAAYSITP